MAGLDKFGSIDKILRDTSPSQKTGLIWFEINLRFRGQFWSEIGRKCSGLVTPTFLGRRTMRDWFMRRSSAPEPKKSSSREKTMGLTVDKNV